MANDEARIGKRRLFAPDSRRLSLVLRHSSITRHSVIRHSVIEHPFPPRASSLIVISNLTTTLRPLPEEDLFALRGRHLGSRKIPWSFAFSRADRAATSAW